MLDESATYPDWEVYWDCDSPTPSAWRNLQAPKLSDDELLGSPQLPKTKKRKAASTASLMNNRPGCEQSQNEVYQIINALRRASRDGCESQSSVSCVGKLVIPDIPEEEESEDEKHTAPVPSFRASVHPSTYTSMDRIFDMSGSGEDLAPTATNGKTQYPCGTRPKTLPVQSNNAEVVPKAVSPNTSDTWTDDDLFSDDLLMSQIEKIPSGTTPAKATVKVMNQDKPQQRFLPKASSNATKHDMEKMQSGDGGCKMQNSLATTAKGFLDFFMDSGTPAKPSPEKHNSNVLKKKNDYKFSKNTVTQKTLQSCSSNRSNFSSRQVLPMDANCSGNDGMTVETTRRKPKKSAKSIDADIPLHVLEELAMEDSWTEGEETTPLKRSNPTRPTACQAKQGKFSSCQNTTLPSTNKFIPDTKAKPSTHATTGMKRPFKRSHTVPFQTKNHQVQSKMVQSLRGKACQSNPISNAADDDGFSSDDEEFLLEAAALSESQQSAKSAGTVVQTRKIASGVKPPSQPKCTRSEIEMKKRMAMERRMKNMRNQRSSRT